VDLLIAPFGSGFGFVEALESAIVTLVETPGVVLFYGLFAKFFENAVHGVVGSLKNAAEGHIEAVAFLFEKFAGFGGFFFAVWG
jgi:hypothetical protein